MEDGENDPGVSIGRISLKQVRVRREESKPHHRGNALVPYLDLFCRLSDEELARLADVDAELVANLRHQVIAIDEGLQGYADLLPRLSDDELVRLTGATPKTIRFWRLCQPRSGLGGPASVAAGARQKGNQELQQGETSATDVHEAAPVPVYEDGSSPIDLR